MNNSERLNGNFVSSNSEAKRSVVQGAVKINGIKILDPFEQVEINNGVIIRLGIRKFAKISHS